MTCSFEDQVRKVKQFVQKALTTLFEAHSPPIPDRLQLMEQVPAGWLVL